MDEQQDSMDIQQDSTDTRIWMCRVPHGSRAPVGVGSLGDQDTCESKIPRTMGHKWEQGPVERDS